MVRVRFAPSPTGPLHIGGARTALFNYLVAKNAGGSFILRIDDTDTERSLAEYEDDITGCLRWLGLQWDEGPDTGGKFGPYRQSERFSRHRAAAEYLLKRDFAYHDSEGVVRLRYPNEEIVVDDLVCGKCVFQPRSLGPEPALVRSDGTPTYHLASVSDDIEMEITHVIRGQDHLTNTAKHVLICRGLDQELPEFAHLPLILGEDGTKLSKRSSLGMTTVKEFREAGYLAPALTNFLVLLGWSHPEAKEHLSLEDGIRVFSLDRIGQTASIFETAKLQWLNKYWLKQVSHEYLSAELLPFLSDYQEVLAQRGEGYWDELVEVVRNEVPLLSDVSLLAPTLFSLSLKLSETAESRIQDAAEKAQFAAVADGWSALLQAMPPADGRDRYTKEEFSQLLNRLKKSVSVPPKFVFQGVRLAITGETSGPELTVIVPLIPYQLLAERVRELQALFA